MQRIYSNELEQTAAKSRFCALSDNFVNITWRQTDVGRCLSEKTCASIFIFYTRFGDRFKGENTNRLHQVVNHPFGVQIFSLVLGYVLVFRTNMALSRSVGFGAQMAKIQNIIVASKLACVICTPLKIVKHVHIRMFSRWQPPSPLLFHLFRVDSQSSSSTFPKILAKFR